MYSKINKAIINSTLVHIPLASCHEYQIYDMFLPHSLQPPRSPKCVDIN